MAFKYYDVVSARSADELKRKLNEKIGEGWQPYGAMSVSSVSGTEDVYHQAIAAEGDVTTPVVVTPEEGGAVVSDPTREPEYYYVLVTAGQSNNMATGEGMPLPDSYDRPDPRIKQLARRSVVRPGGAACKYNDVIEADHCLHDVEDMSAKNHPNADLSRGQYGCVGHGLHIAKRLLPYIPVNAGILIVPCSRGGSAFTDRAEGTYIGYESASQLLITAGDNPQRLRSESGFAALCGVSPVPVSSGKTNRYRLNRGGDRAANSALHIIAIGRLRTDAKTKEYVARRVAEGHTKMEAIRCLKRYISREVYTLLRNQNRRINSIPITA